MHSFKDPAPFGQRLAEAIAWCSRCIADDPAHSLRTPMLTPHLLEKTRAQLVLWTLRSREQHLPRKLAAIRSDRQLDGGRLVCFYPDAGLADGAAAVASEGFFDDNNVPPWDTWVGLYGSGARQSDDIHLVAYVPRTHLDRAAVGIDVNPEHCIVWLSDSDSPIASALREQGWKF